MGLEGQDRQDRARGPTPRAARRRRVCPKRRGAAELKAILEALIFASPRSDDASKSDVPVYSTPSRRKDVPSPPLAGF